MPSLLGPQKQPNLQKRDLPPLGSEIIGKTDEGRPMVRNQDNSVSTERTVTVEVDGKWVNIPTMFGGKQVSQEDAFEIMRRNNFVDPETGRKMEFFQDLDTAVGAARKRSSRILK